MWTYLLHKQCIHLSQSYFHHYRVDHGILHSLCQALSRRTGQNISLSLDNVIESLKLNFNDFLLYSINDNAANMHCAIDISDYWTEINCAIHTLELSIKDGVTNTQSERNGIAKYVNKSTVANTELKKACEECNV